jgi:hypothetical protein
MRRLVIASIAFMVACGTEPAGDSGSTAAADDSGTDGESSSITDTSGAGDDDGGTTSAGSSDEGSSDAADSTTAEMPAELPGEAAGEWLCTGFEDPLYLTLSMPSLAGDWSGNVCGPEGGDTPSEWTACDKLHEHVNIAGTQAYWTFEIPYAVGDLSLDLALDYVPAVDELQGFVFPNAGGGPVEETCARAAE